MVVLLFHHVDMQQGSSTTSTDTTTMTGNTNTEVNWLISCMIYIYIGLFC